MLVYQAGEAAAIHLGAVFQGILRPGAARESLAFGRGKHYSSFLDDWRPSRSHLNGPHEISADK